MLDLHLILSIASLVLNGLFLLILTLAGMLIKGHQKQFEEHRRETKGTEVRLSQLELLVVGKHITREELNAAAHVLERTISEGQKSLWDKIDQLEKIIYVTKAAERRSHSD